VKSKGAGHCSLGCRPTIRCTRPPDRGLPCCLVSFLRRFGSSLAPMPNPAAGELEAVSPPARVCNMGESQFYLALITSSPIMENKFVS